MTTPAPDLAEPETPRVPGSHRHGWRVLPRHERGAMIRCLRAGGFTLDQIADFTRENAHRSTISRATADED